MGSLTLFMHISLDGFAAGINGEMNWIHVDDEIFDHGALRIYNTDIAVYGRKTFELMESYWPSAAQQPHPTKHDIEHSIWYEKVKKVVLSRTLPGTDQNSYQVIGVDLINKINLIKESTDKEILVFGSPSAGHSLMNAGLIDNFWFNINPVVLGNGIPVFKNVDALINLELVENKVFQSGVVCISYAKKNHH